MAQRSNFKHINGYNKGMNKDLSLNLFDNKRYLDAEWLTPVNPESNNIGDMVNPKGTLDKITLPNNDEKVIGDGIIRDWIILFTSDESSITRIYKFKDDGTTNSQSVDGVNFIKLYDDTDRTFNYERLGYSISDELSVVTRYENENLQKIYFTCEDNPLRWFNSALSAATILAYDQSDFNIIPDVSLSEPEFVEYTGGNKTAGKVAYSYQLYKVNGNESSFSQLSDLIPISETITVENNTNLYGSDIGTNCNVGVRLKIDNLDTSYSRIRVLAFNYTDQVSDPTLSIIYEGSFAGSSIELIDTGDSLGDYDLSTFRIFHSFLIMPKYIEQKSNILFPSNIKEKYFDIDQYLIDTGATTPVLNYDSVNDKYFWDSRAYRFKSDLTFTLEDADGNTEYSNKTSSNFADIAYNADCVNPYNKVSLNSYYYTNPTEQQKYDATGALGATGPHVSYKFDQDLNIIDYTTKHYSIDGTVNDAILGTIGSWQRDEIYRTYIQFENYLGQKSFPKWVDDIRIPNPQDSTGGNALYGSTFIDAGDTTHGIYIFPQFKVTNLPKNPDGTPMKWRILKVKRDSANKTVLGTGIVSATGMNKHGVNRFGCFEPTPAYDYKNAKYYRPTNIGSIGGIINYLEEYDLDNTYVQLIIPEILFEDINLDNAQLHNLEWIRLASYEDYYYKGTYTETSEWKRFADENIDFDKGEDKTQIVRKFRDTIKTNYATKANQIVNIDEWRKVSPSDNDTFIDYVNIVLNQLTYSGGNFLEAETGEVKSAHGTCVVAQLDSKFDIDDPAITGTRSDTAHYCIKVLIKKDTIPYGGNSYEAKLRNFSSPASVFTTNSSTYVKATKGDTYMSYFEYLRTQMPEYVDEAYQEVLYIPVESQYNFNFRVDKSFNSVHNTATSIGGKLKESGLVDSENGAEIASLYRYNPVYSRENDSEVYLPLQLDSNIIDYYDTRIRRSQIKSNGEFSDSWLKYLQNDYIDVDGQYGPITRLGVFKDRLLFFQETGFGTVPVGEKELIPSNSSSTLSLGSSGILNRFDYLSDKVGSDTKHGIVFTSNAVYIFSNKYNTMYLYKGQEIPISDQLGMNSWFEEYVSTDTIIRSGYNPYMNEIMYNFGGKVLVFNELADAFVYYYPNSWSNVYYYLNNANNFYSFYRYYADIIPVPNRKSNGYKHNIGDRNQIYDSNVDSSITIVINPGNTVMNVYDVLELLTEVYNSSDVEQNKTFTSIRIWNDYQDTGTITLTPDSNIKRRFRTWRFNKIRDNSNKDPKIRSSQIKVKLTFSTSTDERIILHNLITNYRPSKMMY